MIRLAVIGEGNMGKLVAGLAPGMGFEVVAQLASAATQRGVSRTAVANADVAIEFTAPTAAATLIRACADLGLPVVSGTTGWDAERAAVDAHVRGSNGALLWAPNYAIGVHLFSQVVAEVAKRFLTADAGFDGRIIETHHTRKLDAPSGTARLLASVAEQASGRSLPVTSVRAGDVPGTHELVLESDFEQVRLVHEVRDRRVFAAGALSAARWLVGRRGVFTLDDFLGAMR